MSTIPASLRALLSGLIDYAGLFPPAALDMKTAVANYARYLAGQDAWALGRFVLPVARFAEFEVAMADVQPIEPWGISALIGGSYDSDLAEVDRFNKRNAGKARIDSIEAKASTSDEICQIRAVVRGTIIPYFEIPPSRAGQLLGTIAAIHGRAKIRTGGVTHDAFPSTETVARFLFDCAWSKLPFKATAGLHHPVRCLKPLTYETNAPKGMMHGFLNVFFAASCAEHKASVEQLMDLLERTSPKEFRFYDEYAQFANHQITTNAIRHARRSFAISFGSCSFEEPLADLRELKLL